MWKIESWADVTARLVPDWRQAHPLSEAPPVRSEIELFEGLLPDREGRTAILETQDEIESVHWRVMVFQGRILESDPTPYVSVISGSTSVER